MDYPIRRLLADELDAAMELAWDTYLRFEAPDYGPEGVETFRKDIIENESFHEACRSGKNRMWGAFDGDLLVGLFVMRGKSHIVLVFTHHAYHRRGIAGSIFKVLLDDLKRENPELSKLTLNSSPYGKPFYLHAGFTEADAEKTINGIRFTAMEYRIQ